MAVKIAIAVTVGLVTVAIIVTVVVVATAKDDTGNTDLNTFKILS